MSGRSPRAEDNVRADDSGAEGAEGRKAEGADNQMRRLLKSIGLTEFGRIDNQNEEEASCWSSEGSQHRVLSVSIVVLLLSTIIYSYRLKGDALLTAHAVFMSASFLLFAASGAIWYRGAAKSREGQGAEEHLKELTDKYAYCQALSGISGVIGLIFQMLRLSQQAKPHLIVLGSAHSIIGWLTLLGLAYHALVGYFKVYKKKENFRDSFQWHAESGLVVFSLGCLSVMLGTKKAFDKRGLQKAQILIDFGVVLVWMAVMWVHLLKDFPGKENSSGALRVNQWAKPVTEPLGRWAVAAWEVIKRWALAAWEGLKGLGLRIRAKIHQWSHPSETSDFAKAAPEETARLVC